MGKRPVKPETASVSPVESRAAAVHPVQARRAGGSPDGRARRSRRPVQAPGDGRRPEAGVKEPAAVESGADRMSVPAERRGSRRDGPLLPDWAAVLAASASPVAKGKAAALSGRTTPTVRETSALAAAAAGRGLPVGLSPADAVFGLLCFEGPDRYSLAGGLGSRVTGLSEALARSGAETHLYFIGDPRAPGVEVRLEGRLTLHRWSQWISRYYGSGVYHGEHEKLYDFNETVPWDVLERVVRPAAAAGRHVFLLAEDWHTAEVLCRCSDILHGSGLRGAATLVWNANNPMGFDRINWGRLGFIANLTTVSRYMKHYMWGLGQNPMVIPNGIPESLLRPVPAGDAARIRQALDSSPDQPVFVKVARWDPDKRWVMAVHAVAALRRQGLRARLVAKGGIEAHQQEVWGLAHSLHLRVAEAQVPEPATPASLADVLAAARGADIVNLRGFLPADLLQALYRGADAVLANSGMEPFGLVGLEAMASGAIVFTGATGEDYARPLQNAVVLETDDAGEIARSWLQLRQRDDLIARIRKGACTTAAEYAWPAVLEILMHRLDYLAAASGK